MAETIATYNKILADLQAKKYAPIYLLQGDETYFTHHLAEFIEHNALQESERAFNQAVWYGSGIAVKDILDKCRCYPVLGSHQLVMVKDAQHVKNIEELLPYCDKPVPSTILVLLFNDKPLAKNTKIFKALAKHTVFSADKLRDYEIKKWLPTYLQSKGRSIDSAAVDALIDLLGDDLELIINEINKTLINVKDQFIRQNHIEANVGMSKTYSIFELQKALGEKDFNKSIQIAHQMSKNGDINPATSASLFNFFIKILKTAENAGLNDFELVKVIGGAPSFMKDYRFAARNYPAAKIGDIIGYINLFDLQLKGVNKGAATNGELLIELVVKILHN